MAEVMTFSVCCCNRGKGIAWVWVLGMGLRGGRLREATDRKVGGERGELEEGMGEVATEAYEVGVVFVCCCCKVIGVVFVCCCCCVFGVVLVCVCVCVCV